MSTTLEEVDADDQYPAQTHIDTINRFDLECWSNFNFDELPDASLDSIAQAVGRSSRLPPSKFAIIRSKVIHIGNIKRTTYSPVTFIHQLEIDQQTKRIRVVDRLFDQPITYDEFIKKTFQIKQLPYRCPGPIPTLEQLAFANVPANQLHLLKSADNVIHRPHKLNQIASIFRGGRTKKYRGTNKVRYRKW
jgi:hypothetical protein